MAIGLTGIGLAVLASEAVKRFLPSYVAFLPSVVTWLVLAVATIFAFALGRPRGLTKFRAVDVLCGVVFGVMLRMLQGILSDANGHTFPLLAPVAPLPWISLAVSAVVIGPLVEEFLLRAVILVGVFHWLRKPVGSLAAGFSAAIASSSLFVVLHFAFSALTLNDAVQLFMVGMTCALLVLLTGRIWGAVLTHSVYNLTYILLGATGALLS